MVRAPSTRLKWNFPSLSTCRPPFPLVFKRYLYWNSYLLIPTFWTHLGLLLLTMYCVDGSNCPACLHTTRFFISCQKLWVIGLSILLTQEKGIPLPVSGCRGWSRRIPIYIELGLRFVVAFVRSVSSPEVSNVLWDGLGLVDLSTNVILYVLQPNDSLSMPPILGGFLWYSPGPASHFWLSEPHKINFYFADLPLAFACYCIALG